MRRIAGLAEVIPDEPSGRKVLSLHRVLGIKHLPALMTVCEFVGPQRGLRVDACGTFQVVRARHG